MKKTKKLKQNFGFNNYKLIDFPKKISGVKISRILYGIESGCSYCFPHGIEVANGKHTKYQRNWKKYRKTQWKDNKSKCRTTEILRGSGNTGSNPVLQLQIVEW
nr:phosphate ABC transporter substrate-binding protein [uncultured Chryseobacterium sp.]